MLRKFFIILILFCTSFLIVPHLCQAAPEAVAAEQDEFSEYDDEVGGLSDPLEVINRGIFTFNDRLHLWVSGADCPWLSQGHSQYVSYRSTQFFQ